MFGKIYLAAVHLAQATGGSAGATGGQSGSTGCGTRIQIPQGLPDPTKGVTFSTIILSISEWALGIAGSLGVLILIVGGILYLTSAGNQERIEKAKKTIRGAIIGLVIILLSAVIVFSLGRIFAQPSGQNGGSGTGGSGGGQSSSSSVPTCGNNGGSF